MATKMRPPHSRGRLGGPGNRAEALRRARVAAEKAASLRELGDEFAALAAETDARRWLRKFAIVTHRLPGGAANQD